MSNFRGSLHIQALPRWVYPEKTDSHSSVFLQPWDLYTYSTQINIFVSEYDDGQSMKEVHTIFNQYVNKLDSYGEAEGSGTNSSMKQAGVKMGYGYNLINTNTSTTEINSTVGTDDLGNLTFNYSDPVIVDDSQKSTKGYKVFSVKSGNAVEAILLPKSVYE